MHTLSAIEYRHLVGDAYDSRMKYLEASQKAEKTPDHHESALIVAMNAKYDALRKYNKSLEALKPALQEVSVAEHQATAADGWTWMNGKVFYVWASIVALALNETSDRAKELHAAADALVLDFI